MTITYQPKNEPEWVIGGSKPLAAELWNILSADDARRWSDLVRDDWPSLCKELNAYADKVDELQGRE